MTYLIYGLAGIGALTCIAGAGICLIGWYENLFNKIGDLADPHRAVLEFWLDRCKKRKVEHDALNALLGPNSPPDDGTVRDDYKGIGKS
jgi:hypothetical protein